MRGFRVWSKSLGKYIDFGMMISQDGELLYMDVGHEFQEVPSEDCIDYIVEYPIGLKDKNGKEIYEGDIVRAEDIPKKTYEIFWDGDDLAVIMRDCHDRRWEIFQVPLEVVGNIHENPELLEEEE